MDIASYYTSYWLFSLAINYFILLLILSTAFSMIDVEAYRNNSSFIFDMSYHALGEREKRRVTLVIVKRNFKICWNVML